MSSDEGISHTGRRQRLRERVLSGGAEGMTDREMLEHLLGYALPRQDVNPLGHRLMDAFGSLNGVLHASPEQIQAVQGAGPSVAAFLQAYAAVVDDAINSAGQSSPAGEDMTVQRAMQAMFGVTQPTLAAQSANGAGGGCHTRPWPDVCPPDGVRWLIGVAARLNTTRLALVWLRAGAAELTATEQAQLDTLKSHLQPAGVIISHFIVLNEFKT